MRKHTIIPLTILLVLTFGNSIQFAHAVHTTDIVPTDDAYVVANYDDPSDKEGLEHVNTGYLPFFKAWYAWDVTKTGHEKIISIVYLKFNLTKINGTVESASLILHPFDVNLTAPLRPVDIYTGLNSNWNESRLVFIGAPAFSTADNSTAYISNSDVNKSVSWDITRQVRSHEGSFLTLVLVIKNSYIHNEELINFYSKEAGNPLLRPQIVLVTSLQPGTMQVDGTSANSTINPVYVYVMAGVVSAVIAAFVLERRSRKNKMRFSVQNH